jgi:hypothetical protein
MTKTQFPLAGVGQAIEEWAADHPGATIGSFREFVEAALTEWEHGCHEDDEPVGDSVPPPKVAEFILYFPEDPDLPGEPVTCGDRLIYLQNDAHAFSLLADELGDDFPLSDFSTVEAERIDPSVREWLKEWLGIDGAEGERVIHVGRLIDLPDGPIGRVLEAVAEQFPHYERLTTLAGFLRETADWLDEQEAGETVGRLDC